MKIFLIDDHVLFREGLISLLSKQSNFLVVGFANDPSEISVKLQETKPDFVLLDLAFDDGNGLELLKMILSSTPSTNVVILTFMYSDELLIECLRAGAKGYLLKNQPFTSLMSSLIAIERGEVAITRMMTRRIVDELLKDSTNGALDLIYDGLTKRETQVLELLATGASNLEIASQLVISEYTVKNHVHQILAKTGARNRREAALLVRRRQSFNSRVVPNQSNNHSLRPT